MLIKDPTPGEDRAGPRRPPAPLRRTTILGLSLIFISVVVLRNDIWNWNTPHPLLFGVIPVGLWWQGLVSILAAGMMWLMVRLAWPHELEQLAERSGQEDARKEP